MSSLRCPVYIWSMSRIYSSLLFLLGCMAANGQPAVTLSGRIMYDSSHGIAGASVSILNTHIGTYTDMHGRFELTNIPAGSYILQVSAIGFAIVSKEVQEKDGRDITIVLPRSPVHLDEVVVSAQKREEILQQLPLSISALSAKKTEEYRVWNTRDITAIVPNLYAAGPGDDRNVTSIRGITSASYDPAIATYIDGVNQFSLDTYIAQLWDIERIEVLRGPQGTLYGRNAMGGVINIITKKPADHATGFATVNLGNYGRQRYSLGIRSPLGNQQLFGSASVMYDRSDGYYTNEHTHSSFDKKNSITGNYHLSYTPSSRLAIAVNVKHNNARNNGAFPLVNGMAEAFAHPFRLSQDATSKMIDNTLNASLSVNYTGSRMNFTSQTAWQINHRYYTLPLDGDFSPIDGVTIINNYGNKWNRVKALTQEFRFSSPASISSAWKWTTGLYLFHQSIPNKQATHFGNDADLLGSPDKNFSLIHTSRGKSLGAAAYGQAAYAITSKLELTAGLRYDHEYKRQSVMGEYQKDPDPNPLFATQPDTSATTCFGSFSPKIALAYRLSNSNTGYVTYSRGYRAGGFTQLSSDPSQPPLFSYKPEYSDSYEAGLKNNFGNNRLFLAFAFFYTRVANAQVPALVLPEAITITKNAGKLHSRGIELELLSKPVRGLEIDYNFGYTRATFGTLKLSRNGTEQDFDGNRQVFTPATTSVLAVQYSVDLCAGHAMKFIGRAEWMALGEQYFDLANTIRQPAYSIFNTRFGLAGKNAELIFWLRNITGKTFIAYAYDFGAVHLGDPCVWGITLTGRF